MVCEHCQTTHDLDELHECPTCGGPLHHEDDVATRVVTAPGSPATPAPKKPESELATGGGTAGQTRSLPSGSGEADIATGAGAPARPESRSRSGNEQATENSPIPGWTSVTGGAVDGALCLVPGAVLGGRYQILSVLGEGGMGSVYKARDLEVNRVVAIKIIRTELANDPLIVQRFKQELVLARQVTHRNVVRIYDLGAASGMRFISMEYIEGRELADVLREQGKLDPKAAAEIMLQVCLGLEAAHAQGVIHRDLKPQNIMLDSHGRAAVMDFGIARSGLLDAGDEAQGPAGPAGNEGLTRFGSLLGTPRYMSPEQAQGRAVDARSDIYTVGLILYELLAGKMPFAAASVRELLRRRGKDAVVPLTALDRGIPKALNDIALKCLESSPEARYQSISELIGDLEIWLGLRSKGTPGLNRWTAAAASVALLAIIGASLLLRERIASNASKSHRPVTVLISDFRNSTGEPLLSGVVEPMLQVAVEGASFISSYNRGQAHKIGAAIRPGAVTIDQRLGRLVAIREGIGVVIGGSLERRGEGLRLSATATDSAGKVLSTEDADFDRPNDLPKAVDKVASRIRRVLGDETHSSEKSAAETFTSGSLASAQKYAAAQQLQWDGKWADAIAAYREAIALDPNMSRAYAGIAALLANRGERQQAAHYYQLALAHIDRESDREKYRTRGGYYLLMRNYQKAAEQFGQLVKQYPVDSAGLANLALSDFYARNMTAALEQGRKAVQISPNNILQRNNVGLYAMYAGDFDAAIRESEALIKMSPSFEKAYLCLGISQLQKGLPGDAAATYEKLRTLSDWGGSEAALALGDLALYQGHFRDAVQILQAGIRSDTAQKNMGAAGVKLVALAQTQLHEKERGAALKTAAQAVAANNDESVLYGAAEVYLHGGDTAAALSLAGKLNDRFEPEPRALGKLIEGEAQMQGGKLHDALASFGDAQKLADSWLGRYDLGRAYIAAKQYPDAENELDDCLKRRGEASAVFLDDEPTVRYVPEIYYYLGIAKAGLDSPDAAKDLQTYLTIKRTSQSDPLVADAERRLNSH